MLAKGPKSINRNINELMSGVRSEGRHKAILTIAKNNNISYEEAQLRQAKRIALYQANKR